MKIYATIGGEANKWVVDFGGTYIYDKMVNGKMSWIKSGGQAIWYYPQFKEWAFGNEDKIGTNWRHITSESLSMCPYNANNDWVYWNFNKWISTNEVKVECGGNY